MLDYEGRMYPDVQVSLSLMCVLGVAGARVAHNIQDSQAMKIPDLGLSILYVHVVSCSSLLYEYYL